MELINFGVHSYDGLQTLILFKEKVLSYKPDLVIFGLHLNDIQRTWTMPIPSSTVSFLRSNSYLFNCIWNRLVNRAVGEHNKKQRGSYEKLYQPDSPLWQNHKAVLKEFKEVSATNGIPLLVVILPMWQDLDERYPYREIHELLVRTLGDFMVPALDLLPIVRGLDGEKYRIESTDIDHPNAEGHRIIAQAIYDKLVRERLFPSPR